VDELIDPISEKWDVPLLKQVFWEEDVQLIRSVHVHLDMDDIVGGHYDRKGLISVKYEYKDHRDV
jgi:hypothetical protein